MYVIYLLIYTYIYIIDGGRKVAVSVFFHILILTIHNSIQTMLSIHSIYIHDNFVTAIHDDVIDRKMKGKWERVRHSHFQAPERTR